MHLSAIRVRNHLFKDVPILMMVCNIMSKLLYYCAVEFLDLAVRLRMISGCSKVHNSKVGIERREEFAYELRTIVRW